MNPDNYTNLKHEKCLVGAAAFLFVSSFVALWWWNTIVVDLFALAPMRFKFAFATVLVVFTTLSFGPVTRLLFRRTET